MIGLNGEKMSKSDGNLVFVSHLRREGVDPAAIRLGLMADHYRSDRQWTDEVLRVAQRRVDVWRSAVALPSGPDTDDMLEEVRECLANDLDTTGALKAVDEWAAAALADTGARVLLVDADLRRPSIAEYLGLEGAVGLTTVLIGRASLEDVVQPWRETSLDILPTGQIPPNPSELLGSRAMQELLAEATASYDAVLLDSPPVLPVTDATVLSGLTGGTLVVAGAGQTHRGQLSDTIEALGTVDTQVLGVVLNRVNRTSSRYAYAYTTYEPLEAGPGGSSSGAPRSAPRAEGPRRATAESRHARGRARKARAAS